MPQTVTHTINGAAGSNGADGRDGQVVPGGRLTLVTGDPLPTTDQLAKTTVYYTPYVHSFISIYDSALGLFVRRDFNAANPSVAVPATTNTPFDVFAFWTGTAVGLETVNWTNDTTRATAIARLNGVFCKSTDATRIYLGTCRTTAVSDQCEDSLTKRFVMNEYNRKERPLQKALTGSGYTYSATTVRQTNANTANKVEFMAGRPDVWLHIQSTQYLISNAAETASAAGCALNSTTSRGGQAVQFSLGLAGAGVLVGSSIREYPSERLNAVNAVENGAGTGTQTWFASGGDRGLYGTVTM